MQMSPADPYVKVWLQFGDKRIEKRKTPIFKCTLNPHFNDSFSFNVPWEKIRECSLDVMVMDFDNIGRNELIGRILLAGELTSYWFVPLVSPSLIMPTVTMTDCGVGWFHRRMILSENSGQWCYDVSVFSWDLVFFVVKKSFRRQFIDFQFIV